VKIRNSIGVRVKEGMNIPMIRIEYKVSLEIEPIIVGILSDLVVALIDKIGQDQNIARNYQNMKCT